MSCITAVRAIRFVTVNVMWQPGSSLQPKWQELLHMFCFMYVFSSLNLSRRLGWSFWRLNRPRPSCPTYRCNVKISNKTTRGVAELPADSGLSEVKSDWDETMLSLVPHRFTTLRYTTLKQGTRKQSKRQLITARLTCGCRWFAKCYWKLHRDWHTVATSDSGEKDERYLRK